MYHDAMIELFKQIPDMKSRLLSQDKNLYLLLPFIGSSWYKKKN